MAPEKNECWKPKTSAEKVLLALAIVFFIFTVIGFIIAVIKLKKLHVDDSELCTTKACIEAASYYLKNMDPNEKPCDNFYQYACGGFEAQTILPETELSIGSLKLSNDDIKNKVGDLIKQPSTKTEPRFYTLAKEFYLSCINTTLIEELDSQPLRAELEKMGGWPVVVGSSWKGSNFKWSDTIINFRKHGLPMNVLFNFYVQRDLKQTTNFVLWIDEDSLGFPKEYLLQDSSDPNLQAYYRFMTNTAIYLGAEKDRAKDDMRKVLEFERSIAKLCLPAEQLRNISNLYNKITVNNLQTLVPQVYWVDFLNALNFSKRIDRNYQIFASNVGYLRNMSNLLEATDKRIVANYMMWRIVKLWLSLMSQRFRDLINELTKEVMGTSSNIPRSEYCIDQVFGGLSVAVGAIYVRELFNRDSKPVGDELIQNVKTEFYDSLDKIDWLDAKTRRTAKQKVTAMRVNVAYPEELLNDDKMSNYFRKLQISKDRFFWNAKNILKFHLDFELNQLGPVSKDNEWIGFAATTTPNAGYHSMQNKIDIYAGIMIGAFFDAERPKYLNYGGLGFVTGHEIIHGFDDEGRQYDLHGNLHDWWDPETAKKFKKKAQCIIDLFGSYTIPEIDMNINGIITQGETIADSGGLGIAYKAYVKWEKENGKELQLPGLPLSTRQLFWLSVAGSWCTKQRKEFLLLTTRTDPHPPARFRIIGAFSNSDDFAKDFDCPVGSPMNPRKKCSVW